jgi:hypothetical protein
VLEEENFNFPSQLICQLSHHSILELLLLIPRTTFNGVYHVFVLGIRLSKAVRIAGGLLLQDFHQAAYQKV